MTSISNNDYIGKFDDIVRYNNIYHSTIKTKLIDVKSNTYIDSNKEINNKKSKIKVGDIVRISKYKNVFAKVKKLIFKKAKNTEPWTYVINDLNGEESAGTFYENEL